MTTVADMARWLEGFAPVRLAEPWDNVGLLWGDPNQKVERVMTCLTVTTPTALEAVEERAELIVSHHPVLFKGAKRIRADRPESAPLWMLARAGVSIYSPHTAFDNTHGGINDLLAARLGLFEVRPLRPSAGAEMYKVVVFTPKTDRDAVLSAAFSAGAGRIGAYGECSFTSAGLGTFFGDEGTNPTVGPSGSRQSVRESRVEMVCPADQLTAVLSAIRSRHSYEEPAIDVISLDTSGQGEGTGRIGRLAEAHTLREFAARVARILDAPGMQVVGEGSRHVERVAIVCGAGDDALGDAATAKADVFLTGEARYHRAIEAEELDLGLVVAGHHATERPGVEDLAERIVGAFPGLSVWASRKESDPLRPIT